MHLRKTGVVGAALAGVPAGQLQQRG